MIGVVLAAHGEVASALLKAAEAIVGPMEGVKAITLGAGSSPDGMKSLLLDSIRDVNRGEGVLLLVDMFGGTPSNVCLSTQCGIPIEVVTGVNLPMILKLASVRTNARNVEEAAAQIASYGQRHITHASALLRERKRQAEGAGATASCSNSPLTYAAAQSR